MKTQHDLDSLKKRALEEHSKDEKTGKVPEKKEYVSFSINSKIIGLIIAIAAIVIVGGVIIHNQNVERVEQEEQSGKPYVNQNAINYTASVANTAPATKTDVEDKLYENGKMAKIKTESGTYELGIKEAKILPKSESRDAVYQISAEVDNINFKPSGADGVSIFLGSDINVTDSDGNPVTATTFAAGNEWENDGTVVPPKGKVTYKHTFNINNKNCKYLDIIFPSRGVKFRVNIDSDSIEALQEKDIKMGEAFTVQTSYGSISFQLDQINPISSGNLNLDVDSGKQVVSVDWDVENVDFDYLGQGFSEWNLEELVKVKDSDGYQASPYWDAQFSDGDYEFLTNDLQKGTKQKIAMPVMVSKNSKNITITVNELDKITVPLS